MEAAPISRKNAASNRAGPTGLTSKPTGMDNTPKATMVPVASTIISPYAMPNSALMAITAVGKISTM